MFKILRVIKCNKFLLKMFYNFPGSNLQHCSDKDFFILRMLKNSCKNVLKIFIVKNTQNNCIKIVLKIQLHESVT